MTSTLIVLSVWLEYTNGHSISQSCCCCHKTATLSSTENVKEKLRGKIWQGFAFEDARLWEQKGNLCHGWLSSLHTLRSAIAMLSYIDLGTGWL